MLVDIHKNNDLRNIEVNCIGICDYKLPISFKDQENKFNTIATISSNVVLDKNLKGAHLSRISEVLNEENGRLIEAGDTVNFVEALRLLKSQYEICQELGIKAKQEIKERFNITKYNEQLVNLYREVEA